MAVALSENKIYHIIFLYTTNPSPVSQCRNDSSNFPTVPLWRSLISTTLHSQRNMEPSAGANHPCMAHNAHTHTETDAHIPHKGPNRFKAMLSGWSASSQGGHNAARAISPNMETNWRRVRIYGPQVSSYRPGALSDAGLMGNGFTCLTGFLNKLNEFQQKVPIEIIETNVLNFLTVFADIMLGERTIREIKDNQKCVDNPDIGT